RLPARPTSSSQRSPRSSAAPVPAVVSPRSASSSWTTSPAPSSGTSRARFVRTTSSLSSNPSVRPAASAKRRLLPPLRLSLSLSSTSGNRPCRLDFGEDIVFFYTPRRDFVAEWGAGAGVCWNFCAQVPF
ncbi:hypothetical protein BMF94_3268, partial [Rhodotorula taiwanensis]